jgi:hypothetical protein
MSLVDSSTLDIKASDDADDAKMVYGLMQVIIKNKRQ